ncbi:probable pectinesterase 53 [Selaginella moellendorffii]|uniref:probable pectinesterase 53 n=1 Tax=Selaginella moellendorffii TaxID=88036 RepID=UPI000D1CDF67|nr:probable pectinesterase 53 [Selaginella moellendorffii]|eukprot:XP_024525138.1 probable pectinesterase 53 [Selaginella moellendorffii]
MQVQSFVAAAALAIILLLVPAGGQQDPRIHPRAAAALTSILSKNSSSGAGIAHQESPSSPSPSLLLSLHEHPAHRSFFKAPDSAVRLLNSWARRRGGRIRHGRGVWNQQMHKNRKARNPFKQMAISKYLIVDQYGHGNFKTIQAAVDSIPLDNKQWVYVQINAGLYREKVIIPYNKPFIIFQGAGRDKTTIEWNDAASRSGTADSATFTAWAPSFIAKGISFKNGSPAPPPGAENRQAVAALAAADMQAFYSCGFYGAQDTLFDYQGRHYFRDCYIEGSIDVIFGHAQSIFRECELHSIAESYGSLAAHNRWNPSDSSGFVFVDCTITGSKGQVFLGRAWGAYSRIVYINTRMDNVIIPEGWYDWGVPQRQRTVFFGQYKCSGPGAGESGRVSWSHELNDYEARPFMQINFINGHEWLSEV